MMKYRIPAFYIIPAFLLLSLFSVPTFAQEISTEPAAISAGEAIFNANCKACHRVKEKLVGPALAGIEGRAPSINWIKDWIRNSSKLIASGDEYANKIYLEYNKSQMTAFTSFTDEQIMNVLAYVKAEANKVEVAPVAVAATAGGGEAGGGVPSSYLTIIIIGMILILVLLAVILGLIINILKKYLDQKSDLTEEDKEVVHAPFTLSSITQSSGFIFIVIFIVAAVGFKTVIDGLYSIGVQQGYQPKQPIAFSHKIHAGQYEIDCKYCHTGAAKGKSANIPSPNICMNCHSQIKKGTNTGEGEIAKIYAAVENNRPIEWVRIHNLPDLAYFNHSQHVNVAGVECQTCHGPIQEMDVVKQYSLLTMGWCIDCHRKTDVTTKDNAYYDKLLELHDSKSAMKVEDIGGLECAKCHY